MHLQLLCEFVTKIPSFSDPSITRRFLLAIVKWWVIWHRIKLQICRIQISSGNDDCFYKIFEFLPKVYWCSLRGTCTRFRTISDYLFERKSKSFDFVIGNGLPFDTSVINAKHLIRNFGHFLTELTISRHYFHYDNDTSQLVPFVHRYCHSLKSLELNLVNLQPVTII